MRTIVTAVLLLGMSLGSAEAAETTLEKIKRAGKMVVGNSGVYPPFGFKEGGELVGFDVDVAHLIGKRLGAKPEFVVIEFKGIIPSLKSGRVDLLITGMTYTEDRAKEISFSDPYYDTAMAIAVKKGKAAIQSKADLRGWVVGAEMGTTGEREARSVEGVKEVKTYDTPMLAMRDLEIGRLDAVISTLPPLQYLIFKNFSGLDIGATYNKGFVGINTRKEDADLLAAINAALRDIKQSGEVAALNKKWFGR